MNSLKMFQNRHSRLWANRKSSRRLFRPLVEPLENRLALAVITVDTTDQEVNSNDKCSLPEAIYAANFDRSLAIDPTATDLQTFISTACMAGDGDDTIVLEEGAVYSMSSVVSDPLNQLGPSATPVIFSDITIRANGATLQRTGDEHLRLFSIADLYTGINVDGHGISAGTRGELTLHDAFVTGFQTHGGDGRAGGGGGLGAGGAIYVKDSVLYVFNSTFAGNSAIGGN
ncbi:MAG TPA: CSLREA domain-containing protein, partial [Pirellulaceae bacterium]|nr:CSLREA domain-containing protein [Pirellulaceae bacterium]